MKVLVVAEIRLYRDGVAEALRLLDDVEVVVTSATTANAIVTARRAECDVVLLDMAVAGSTNAVGPLHTARPDVKVVALGVPEDSCDVVTCAEAGINGYVSREASMAELTAALRSAVRGEAPVSGKVAAGLLRHIAVNARVRQSGAVTQPLTPRECEILQLLQNGMTNRQIARTLDLQLSTVKNHVHNILSKSGVACRADVRSWAPSAV
jgi:two-component system nitrate/nitrite response regulator NarL